jgi:serine phosphatase RsbU (regulator of sigma subunit)
MTLQSNDSLVLISDNITEAQDPQQNSYGRENILNFLNALKQADRRAISIFRDLYRDLKQFTGSASQTDNITIMAVRFDAPNPLPPEAPMKIHGGSQVATHVSLK